MKLIQSRIRGLGTLTESRWFELSPHLNLFQFPGQNGLKHGRDFLRILETINPPYVCQTIRPFADFPKLTEQGGHLRRVNPTKRTVALAVFSATSSLVKELATVSEWLYETDRIEVGRRLDYSRWINFVELASSTRWSEISADVHTLYDEANRLTPDLAVPLVNVLRTLRPADRIKNELQGQLAHWLQYLPPELWESSRQLIEKTITAVMRAEHFQAARNIVRSRLPLFVVLGSCDPFSRSLDQKTISGSQQNSASIHHLLDLISNRAKLLANKSRSDEQVFIDGLNEQLATLQFFGKMLQIVRSQKGVLLMSDGKPAQMSTNGPLSSLRQMQLKACLAIASSRVVYRTEPILLFDGPEQALPNTLHGELAKFVIDISNTCQCLYSFSDVNIFPDGVAGRLYSAAELISTGE